MRWLWMLVFVGCVDAEAPNNPQTETFDTGNALVGGWPAQWVEFESEVLRLVNVFRGECRCVGATLRLRYRGWPTTRSWKWLPEFTARTCGASGSSTMWLPTGSNLRIEQRMLGIRVGWWARTLRAGRARRRT